MSKPDLNFIVTGSSVYGPQTKKSDLDIVLCEEGSNNLKEFLKEKT